MPMNFREGRSVSPDGEMLDRRCENLAAVILPPCIEMVFLNLALYTLQYLVSTTRYLICEILSLNLFNFQFHR